MFSFHKGVTTSHSCQLKKKKKRVSVELAWWYPRRSKRTFPTRVDLAALVSVEEGSLEINHQATAHPALSIS